MCTAPLRRLVRWLGKALLLAGFASMCVACEKAEPTGYLLDIRTQPPQDQLPTAVSVNCFKPTGYCLKDFVYPGRGKTLAYQGENNRLLTLAIDVDDDFELPRRLWVRARREFDTLGEYAALLPQPERGKQIKVDVLIKWGSLSDRDRDEVPDVIDDCPDKPDPDQTGGCAPLNQDAGGFDANLDANLPDATMKLDAEPGDAANDGATKG